MEATMVSILNDYLGMRELNNHKCNNDNFEVFGIVQPQLT